MRLLRHVLVAALVLVPALAFAEPQRGAATPATTQKPKAAKAATHSTSGIVRSIDGTTLVIARTAKATATETFELTSDTARKGELVVGAKVGVRYTTTGGRNVATAVTVSAKGKSAQRPKSSH